MAEKREAIMRGAALRFTPQAHHLMRQEIIKKHKEGTIHFIVIKWRFLKKIEHSISLPRHFVRLYDDFFNQMEVL